MVAWGDNGEARQGALDEELAGSADRATWQGSRAGKGGQMT